MPLGHSEVYYCYYLPALKRLRGRNPSPRLKAGGFCASLQAVGYQAKPSPKTGLATKTGVRMPPQFGPLEGGAADKPGDTASLKAGTRLCRGEMHLRVRVTRPFPGHLRERPLTSHFRFPLRRVSRRRFDDERTLLGLKNTYETFRYGEVHQAAACTASVRKDVAQLAKDGTPEGCAVRKKEGICEKAARAQRLLGPAQASGRRASPRRKARRCRRPCLRSPTSRRG